jgi:outer membrane lipoprotein-sorting protein
VSKAENLAKGEKNSYSEMSMQIVRPKYTRTIEFKAWGETDGNSITLITAPAKEKGQSFLKSGSNMWSWNPAIQRVIKMPASMMSQGWMGSDYTNDDILKESSLVKDFTHKITGNENAGGEACYRIELTPLPDADVVWGKIVMWISETEFFEMKTVLQEWIRKFAPSKKTNELSMSSPSGVKSEMATLRKKLSEIEKELKSERMRADFYQTMVEVAEEELKIPIRKKAGAKR